VALKLFNRDGLPQVSTNRIATELDISPGNLYYHFKNKGQLVQWLFRRLERELAPLATQGASLSALDDVWLALHLTFETIEKYRFVYVNLDHLGHEYPDIGARIRLMTAETVKTTRAMCQNLARTGVISAESQQIDSLAFHIVLTSTCWCTFVRIIQMQQTKSALASFAAYHALALLDPYLTPQARHYMNYLRGKYLK
jgi:AcrR family transcriptional regulator